MKDFELTIVIPTKNEEKNLGECLTRIGDFCEVIVVDSSSTDETAKIAKDFGVKIINFNWNGSYPKKKNWLILQGICKTEWMLFLDADEFVTEDFKAELTRRLPECVENGFWLRYHDFFLGRKLSHGIPFTKLFLMRNGRGSFQKVDDEQWTSLDMEVHEQLDIVGEVGVIKAPIIHNNYNGFEHFIQKHNEYSTWEAKRYLYGKVNFNQSFRQRVKQALIDSYLLGPLYFLANYVLYLGFLDGGAGFLYSVLKAHYFLNVKIKIEEIRRAGGIGKESPGGITGSSGNRRTLR